MWIGGERKKVFPDERRRKGEMKELALSDERRKKKKKSTLHYHLIRSWGKSVTNSRYQCKLEAGKKWFGRMMANRSICASRLATHLLTQKPCVQAEHFFSALVWLLHSGKQLCTCGLMAIETFCVPSSQSYSISVKWQFPYLQHICISDIQYTLWSLFKMFSRFCWISMVIPLQWLMTVHQYFWHARATFYFCSKFLWMFLFLPCTSLLHNYALSKTFQCSHYSFIITTLRASTIK